MPDYQVVDNLKTTLTWYSPFTDIKIGTKEDKDALRDMDAEIKYLETLVSTCDSHIFDIPH